MAGPFLNAWADGKRAFDIDGFAVEVVEGDARETLTNWTGRAMRGSWMGSLRPKTPNCGATI